MCMYRLKVTHMALRYSEASAPEDPALDFERSIWRRALNSDNTGLSAQAAALAIAMLREIHPRVFHQHGTVAVFGDIRHLAASYRGPETCARLLRELVAAEVIREAPKSGAFVFLPQFLDKASTSRGVPAARRTRLCRTSRDHT